MANYYGTEYNGVYNAVPMDQMENPKGGGKTIRKHFTFEAPTTPPSLSDVIYLAKIPKSALVTDLVFKHSDMGSTGDLDIGWLASKEKDQAGTVLEAADVDGFFVAVDVNAAAGIKRMSSVAGAAVPGFLKKFKAEVDLVATVVEAWDATSGTIEGYIEYEIP